MQRLPTLLAWLATVAAFAGAQLILMRFVPGQGLPDAFGDAASTTKLLMLASLLALAAALLFSALGASGARRGRPVRETRRVLWIVAALGVALGLLGLLWTELNISLAAAQVGGVRFEVAAPGHAEALLALALGLLAAAVALTGASLARPTRA